MVRCFETRLVVQALFVSCAVFTVYGFAPAEGRDSRLQSRLVSHLETAERAFETGNEREAAAYAEMILLRREITVFVDDSGAPWQIKEEANRALRNAAINWEDSLNREVKFRFVPFRDADVIVNYSGNVSFDGKHAAGTVRWTRQVINLGSGEYRYEVRANITLRTHSPKGDMMNYGQMLHTAGHELGHVLGLEDTAKQGELMGPLRLDRPVERCTRAERDSLLSLRKLANDLLAKIQLAQSVAEENEPHILIQVVSERARNLETTKPAARGDRDQRRADFVRGAVRDGEAAPRKKGFTLTGMGR